MTEGSIKVKNIKDLANLVQEENLKVRKKVNRVQIDWN